MTIENYSAPVRIIVDHVIFLFPGNSDSPYVYHQAIVPREINICLDSITVLSIENCGNNPLFTDTKSL